jgi:hypothetical protein
MEFIKELNNRQGLWKHKENYYIISGSLDGTEVMIFAADAEGDVVSWQDLYVSYVLDKGNLWHAKQFEKELDKHGS